MKRSSPPVAMEVDSRITAVWKKRVPPSRFAAGQVLFYRGHLPYGIWVVHSGAATLQPRRSDSHKPSLQVGRNTILGLSNIIKEEPYPLTAVVVEEIEASFVEKSLLSIWMKDETAIPPLEE
jgi:hypothetical protein